jgi:hypothetical protein
MGDSPFTDPSVHPEQRLGEDTEFDLKITRHKLNVVIARLKETATVVRANPGMAGKFKLFGEEGHAFINRVTTRLEAVAHELTSAGF